VVKRITRAVSSGSKRVQRTQMRQNVHDNLAEHRSLRHSCNLLICKRVISPECQPLTGLTLGKTVSSRVSTTSPYAPRATSPNHPFQHFQPV
jgi:hypothetical protein